jgi:hypothetical protein
MREMGHDGWSTVSHRNDHRVIHRSGGTFGELPADRSDLGQRVLAASQPSRLADAWRKDTLHADKILIVVRDGADASRPQCALAPLCHQPLKRVRREPSIDHRIP